MLVPHGRKFDPTRSAARSQFSLSVDQTKTIMVCGAGRSLPESKKYFQNGALKPLEPHPDFGTIYLKIKRDHFSVVKALAKYKPGGLSLALPDNS